MSKYNVTQNQNESINTNTQIVNTTRQPINNDNTDIINANKQKTKADKLVNNLNNLFNTGSKALQTVSQVQTENAFENANRKILSKGGNLSNTQIEKLNQEVSEEAGIFANVDKVGKKINSKLSVENATFDFTNLKNNVDSNWKHMSNEKKKEFAGKSDYFNSVFSEYNKQSLNDNTEVDTDYALKYANNLNSFKNKTLLSYMAEDAQTKEQEQDFKSNATQTNTAYVNSKHNYINKETGKLESVGEDNKKVLFRQLKDELSLNGNSSDMQIKMLNNIKDVAIQNNNEDLLESVYKSELISEDVRKNVRIEIEKAKITIRSNLSREQLRIAKSNKYISNKDKYDNEVNFLNETKNMVYAGVSKEEIINMADNINVNLKAVSKKVDEEELKLNTKMKVDLEGFSFKEIIAASPENKSILNNQAKNYYNSYYNENILGRILERNSREWTNEEIVDGTKQKFTDKTQYNIQLFSRKIANENSDVLEFVKSQASKPYKYGEQQFIDMKTNELQNFETMIYTNEEMMKNGVDLLNDKQLLEHQLIKSVITGTNINEQGYLEKVRQAGLFTASYSKLDDEQKKKGSTYNNSTNNSDLTDYFDEIADPLVRKKAVTLANALSSLSNKPTNFNNLKTILNESSNIIEVELDGSHIYGDTKITLDLSGTSIRSQDEYNQLVDKAVEVGILKKGEYFATQKIGNNNIFYKIGTENNFYSVNNAASSSVDLLQVYSGKRWTNEELQKALGWK